MATGKEANKTQKWLVRQTRKRGLMHSIGARQGSGFWVCSSQNRGGSCHRHDMVKERNSAGRVPGVTVLGDLRGVGPSAFFDCRIFHPFLEPLPVLFPVFE